MRKLALSLPLCLASLGFCAVASGISPPVLKPGPWIVVEDGLGKYGFLEVDSVRHRLLGSHVNDDTADFFDLDTNQLIARVEIGPVVDIAIDSKTGRYFASVQDDKRVAIIDGQTLKETGSIALPDDTGAILFDAKDRRIYITNDGGPALWAVDPDTKKIIATISIPEGPGCMAHDAAADRIYLNSTEANQVSVIDIKTNSVVISWPTAPAIAPHGLAFDPARNRIFVAGDNGQLVVIDVKTGRVMASAAIGEHVDQIAFDPQLHLVYCAAPDWISVVQASDQGLATRDRIYTAATARNVAVDLKTHAVWTTFTDGEDSYAKSWTPISPQYH